MSEYAIQEDGNPEDGYIWNLMRLDGTTAVLVGQFFDERFAKEIMDAARWRDAFMSGMVGLNMGTKPKKPRAWDIKFEPAPRTKRKAP